ncbi:MAG: hypothetical protein JWL62_1337 [Hyphomicrobiales bacterium]|nr:hypothetical protein [Hyphomicrobiales bacterium]
MEIAFLDQCGVPLTALLSAARRAAELGVTADLVLISEGMVDEETYYRQLARKLGVRFLDRACVLPAGIAWRAAMRTG